VDYFLMYEMRWSWDELQATPHYVRRYCYDFRQIILAYEREQTEKAERERKAELERGGLG
jgi:hypothetical protein